MDTNRELYAIIPAYNEQDTIKQVVSDWQVITDAGGVLVVIDDGSKDNTYSILKELESDSIVVLTKENGGHGDTLLYGYQYAINHGAKYIFQTDSDGQTNAAEFGAFWEERDKYTVKFLTTGLLKLDTETRYKTYKMAIENGILNRNEIRDMEELSAYNGGDKFIVPLNMALIDENGQIERVVDGQSASGGNRDLIDDNTTTDSNETVKPTADTAVQDGV